MLKPPLNFQNGALLIHGHSELKPRFVATQQTWITDDCSLHASVSSFWNQYWRRDNDEDEQNEIKFEHAMNIIQNALPEWDPISIHITPHCYKKRALKINPPRQEGVMGLQLVMSSCFLT